MYVVKVRMGKKMKMKMKMRLSLGISKYIGLKPCLDAGNVNEHTK